MLLPLAGVSAAAAAAQAQGKTQGLPGKQAQPQYG